MPLPTRAVVSVIILAAAAPALAGPLATDPNALPGYASSTTVTMGGRTFTIDSACYNVGSPAGPAVVPWSFVYAYQIYMDAGSPLDHIGITSMFFSIGTQVGVDTSFGQAGGQVPTVQLFGNAPAVPGSIFGELLASFAPPLQPGGFSSVMWLASAAPPVVSGHIEVRDATTGERVHRFSRGIVAPIPGPSTAAGIALALLVGATRRRR